jgi:hypothetical protein
MVVRSDGTLGYVSHVVNVKAWGATSNGATDDTTALDNANTAVNGFGGGKLYFPEGNYKRTTQFPYYANTSWDGDSKTASTVTLATEPYSSGVTPAHFIVPNTGVAFAQGSEWSMRNMTLTGPGPTRTLGQTTSRTTGVQMNAKALIEGCYVNGFDAGLESGVTASVRFALSQATTIMVSSFLILRRRSATSGLIVLT